MFVASGNVLPHPFISSKIKKFEEEDINGME
jgi:hypothetical protein